MYFIPKFNFLFYIITFCILDYDWCCLQTFENDQKQTKIQFGGGGVILAELLLLLLCS